MKDDIHEKLSAYLDGALSDTQRRNVEVEVSRSEEMRQELEALRAVSTAVKGLGKEKLPEGFMARLQARRAREAAAPRRSYRPLALALSTAVFALVVWDKTHAPRELLKPLPAWDGGAVALQRAAPASVGAGGSLSPTDAKGTAADGDKIVAASPEKENAFAKKFETRDEPMKTGEDKLSTLSPVAAPSKRYALQEARVDGRALSLRAAATAAAPAKPAAAAKIAAPIVNAVALRNVAALQVAWTTAGLPGKPPFVDFSSQMALFLSGPPGSGIVSVEDHTTSIVVHYKDSGFSDAFARVRAVTPSSKPITVQLSAVFQRPE